MDQRRLFQFHIGGDNISHPRLALVLVVVGSDHRGSVQLEIADFARFVALVDIVR